MIKIKLDTVISVLKDFDPPTSELEAFAKVVKGKILTEVYANLVQSAKQKLTTSRQEYIKGITLDEDSIYLIGELPNAVEDGCGPFDQKIGFANSSKIKKGKRGGWYLTIPFRIGTPNSGGVLSSAIMPRDIYDAIRSKKAVDLSNTPPQTRGSVTDSKTGKIWEEYQNKYSVFAGITQNKNTETNRSTYNTFRRVSDKSDPNSWIHPGIQAHNLMDLSWANTDIDKIINEGLELLF